MGELTRTSELACSADEAWRHAASPAGVNDELMPLVRMTFPPGVSDLTEGARPGVRLFRSWLLLGGVLPVEWDDLVFEEVEPGRRFLERSSMATQRVWEHERIVEPTAGGCRVTDRVRWQPRIALLGVLLAPVFRLVFWWRHHRLRRRFGGVPG